MDKNEILRKPQLQEARRRSKAPVPVSEYSPDPGLSDLGRDRTYLLQTYGCQGNEADSEKIRGLLESLGFRATESEDSADLVVFNTCAIRENAEDKVFGEVGRIKRFKDKKPGMLIAVGGCMPQEETVVDRILKKFPQVDVVFGTHNLHRLPGYLRDAMAGKRPVVDVWSGEGEIVERVPAIRQSGVKAWVNIMYGCDEFCTYCIVPYTRGKERSRRPEEILAEVRDLAQKGYGEVTLLGQNVNSYGLDFTDRTYAFPDLLADLAVIPIPRIRFTTSHPKDFSDQLIAVLAHGGNLMPSIHLPVQSGSDRILKAMNRKYTKAGYLSLVSRIRSAMPEVSLTTDLIVGFPGETEADFRETLDLVEKAGFEGAYTFVFSPRSGTPAAAMADETPAEEKMNRLYRLNELVNLGYGKGNDRFTGKTVKVLVEGPSKNDPGVLSGYTEHNKIVNFRGPSTLVGKIVPVKIAAAKTWSLDGEPYDGD